MPPAGNSVHQIPDQRHVAVVHGTWGTFHLDLSRQLEKRGLLEAVFSSYPWWKLKHECLPRQKVHCRWLMHTSLAALRKYGIHLGTLETAWKRAMARDYTAWLVRNIPACDVFVGQSGVGLAAGRLTQQRGGKYICDRGSSHISYMENLVEDEFRRWDMAYERTDPQYVAIEEAEYHDADIVNVHSSFAARSFVEMGIPASKVRSVPFGADVGHFHKIADPPRDSFHILFVGQLNLRKGIPYLMEAFRRFKHPGKHLTLVGTMGPDIKRWLAGRSFEGVSFTGHVPRRGLATYYSTSHVLALPSIEDGFGIVLTQALACGCPLIASTNTGGPDVIEHRRHGFIVPIRDSAAILDCLEELAENPQLQTRMSEAALRRVAEIGGCEAYGDGVERMIRELSHARPGT